MNSLEKAKRKGRERTWLTLISGDQSWISGTEEEGEKQIKTDEDEDKTDEEEEANAARVKVSVVPWRGTDLE